jgi:hypothetical protein
VVAHGRPDRQDVDPILTRAVTNVLLVGLAKSQILAADRSLTLFPYAVDLTLRLDQRADFVASNRVGTASYRLTMGAGPGAAQRRFRAPAIGAAGSRRRPQRQPQSRSARRLGAIKQADALKLARPMTSTLPAPLPRTRFCGAGVIS